MFKLLTQEGGDKVRQEYVMRRAIVMLLALIFILVVAIIGLLPSYVLSNARQSEVLERTRLSSESSLVQENAKLQEWLVQTNNELRRLSPKFDIDRPSDFINKVINEKSPGVSLTGFSWSKDREAKINLSVKGVARNRQSLISFEDSINASGHFKDVVSPISNLANNSDIDFEIRFSPALPKTP